MEAPNKIFLAFLGLAAFRTVAKPIAALNEAAAGLDEEGNLSPELQAKWDELYGSCPELDELAAEIRNRSR